MRFFRVARRNARKRRRAKSGDGDDPRAAQRSGRVYLSFDDGPDPEWTPRVLDELARLDLRATFFVIGERVARHPEPVVRALAEGHEVELHCMRHVAHPETTREAVAEDTREALAVLAGLGITPRRWRVPGLVQDLWSAEVAAEHGLRLTGASADPRDWAETSATAMLANVDPGLRAGHVVVMHDGVGPGALRTDCAGTVDLIEPLVERIRARGLEPAALGEGPAFWWLRSMPAPPPGVSISILEEDALAGDRRRAVHALLARVITRSKGDYRERGYRRLRPQFRAVARAHGRLVGVTSAFILPCDPPLAAYGSGDSVVHPAWQGLGLGTAMVHAALTEARRRGADLIVADTVTFGELRELYRWRAVPRLAFYYERDGACHWHPRWGAWSRADELPSRLRLEEGDF